MHHRHPARPQTRVASLQAQRQQMVMRIVGALVGLTIVATGLFALLSPR